MVRVYDEIEPQSRTADEPTGASIDAAPYEIVTGLVAARLEQRLAGLFQTSVRSTEGFAGRAPGIAGSRASVAEHPAFDVGDRLAAVQPLQPLDAADDEPHRGKQKH